jgi:hypothetical protein
METTRFPFVHYGDDEMYRVTSIQNGQPVGLDAPAMFCPPLEQQLDTLLPETLFEQIDNHLQLPNRTPTPFVSVWSDRARALNVATLVARGPHTRRNSVSMSRFLSSDYLMINVEEYIRYRGLEMNPRFQHEWLVPDGISIESVCGETAIDTDENGNVRVERE